MNRTHILQRLFVFIICIWVGFSFIYAQELKVKVEVINNNISGVDNNTFNSLKSGLSDLINNKNWTKRNNSGNRKNNQYIDCSFILTISEKTAENTYKGNLQVQASRPVFNSSYTTTLLNIKDNNIKFDYITNESLDYNENVDNKDIVDIFMYYTYLIFALDADSFSKYGGNDALQKLRSIVRIQKNQSAGSGWEATSGKTNRYQIMIGLTSSKTVRLAIYNYHRMGLDNMAENPRDALQTMKESVLSIKRDDNLSLKSATRLFFDAKYQEITDSFSALNTKDKKIAYLHLSKTDPGHLETYKALE